MKCIFLDTNIFLHFQYFENIDWLTESKAKSCRLVIAPRVIDELDEKKVGTGKLATRARKVLNRLEELLESGTTQLGQSIEITIILDKPGMEVYEEANLNFEEPDQKLLASIHSYKKDHPNSEIILCSNDVGPRIRAKRLGVDALKLNDKYRLPSEQGANERELLSLKKENELLKSKLPKLKLVFDNDEEFITLEVPKKETIDFEEFKNSEMEKTKNENPYLDPKQFHRNRTILPSLPILGEDQVTEFNNKLETFLIEYEKALEETIKIKKKEKLMFDIQIVISNYGRVPAEDIDIHLHFPDGFELIQSIEKPKYPKLPKPPYRPKHQFDIDPASFQHFTPNFFTPQTPNKPDQTGPSIKKTNSYDVDYVRPSLKHQYKGPLEKLTLIFDTYESISSFTIDYVLTAANMPELATGKLNVILEKK